MRFASLAHEVAGLPRPSRCYVDAELRQAR